MEIKIRHKFVLTKYNTTTIYWPREYVWEVIVPKSEDGLLPEVTD